MGITILGGASYNALLSEKKILADQEFTVSQVYQQIKKLHTPVFSAKPRQQIHRKPRLENKAR